LDEAWAAPLEEAGQEFQMRDLMPQMKLQVRGRLCGRPHRLCIGFQTESLVDPRSAPPSDVAYNG
jgi:hypothetical protein